MRSLSGALSAALGAPVQQPAVLVEIAFGIPVRWSSFSTLTWNSLSWTRQAMSLESLNVEALRVSGSLVVGNGDDVMAALVLGEGIADKAIRIWGYDAAATALGDVVHLGDAVGAGAEINTRSVSVSLRSPSEFMQSPRTFVGVAAGFRTLIPSGAVVKIGALSLRLERR